MNSPDTQPGLDPAKYFDLDGPDTSEQQFSASLEAPIVRPRFVVDVPEEPGAVAEPGELGGESVNSGSRARVALKPVSKHLSEAAESRPGAREYNWRDQVSAKVSNYRSRKPKKDRYPSLQLRFEGNPTRDQTPPGAVPDVPVLRAWVGNPELQAPPDTSVALEATARVLEFPRFPAPPSRQEELADPVMGRPRIVEAPELLLPPPALGGILIESAVPAETERRRGFDVPLESAPLSRRLLAGVVDAGVVAMALTAFAYVFFRISGAVPPWRTVVEATTALLAVLWPAYQYAFLVFSKTTPGLRFAGLEVTRFDGAPASRRHRRWRVLASLLSCASLGLGYAWCFLDEDQLSWHDRITRTHLGTAPRIQRE